MKPQDAVSRWISAGVELACFGAIGAALIRSGWPLAGVCILIGAVVLALWLVLKRSH